MSLRIIDLRLGSLVGLLIASGCSFFTDFPEVAAKGEGGGATTSSGASTASTSVTGSGGGSSASSGGGGGGASSGEGGGYTCGQSGFEGGLLEDGGFERDGTWTEFDLGYERLQGDSCEGASYARLTAALLVASLRADGQIAEIAGSPCVEWSFEARRPTPAAPHVEIFLSVSGDGAPIDNNITGTETVLQQDWSHFEGTCRLVMPASPSAVAVAISVSEQDVLDIDAVSIRGVSCPAAIADCHVP